MSEVQIIAPPGYTQQELEKLLEQHLSNAILDSLISYLKKTADIMDEAGLEHMTSDDLRRIALEMATTLQ